jgi:hypothetical protein
MRSGAIVYVRFASWEEDLKISSNLASTSSPLLADFRLGELPLSDSFLSVSEEEEASQHRIQMGKDRKPRTASYASHASELDGKDCQRKLSIHSILLSS